MVHFDVFLDAGASATHACREANWQHHSSFLFILAKH
jgi:hypothetical protein